MRRGGRAGVEVKSSLVAATIILCASFAASALPPPEPDAANLVFLESSDAQGKLPRSKLVSSMSELVRQMKLAGKKLPRLLVVHVSSQDANTVGVRQNAMRHNTGDLYDEYYELWIIGDAHPAEYTAAFEQMLERHFSLEMTEAERKRVITHVVRYLDATVSAYAE
jgi:hypothetical protein